MVIDLENSELKLTVRPDLGGRIDQIHDRHTGKDWLWHPAQYDPNQTRSLPIGASFDQNWTGGWDEMFPNDAAGSFKDRTLMDHGEVWSQGWQILETSPQQVRMGLTCQTVPVTIEKTIRLHETEPQFHIEYQLQNQSQEMIPFLLKQHAAIAIAAEDEIVLPDCCVEPVTLDFSKIIGQAKQTRFPQAFDANGDAVDLRRIPPRESQLQEFYYCSDLQKGECGIYNPTSRSALIMQFDQADFPYVWVFQSYGGWQDHYVLVMEPCTTISYDLEVAYQQGTTPQLVSHEQQQRSLTVRLKRD